MSNSPTISPNDSDAPNGTGELTDDERDLFERLADRYEGEDVGRICEVVLQSSDSNEEANS